ncbi:MAG: hypothetical protein MUF54_25330, partial [Polyangiaceae bacterium]|nr:hypothetical protein [Polyangiaceae bacterium]
MQGDRLCALEREGLGGQLAHDNMQDRDDGEGDGERHAMDDGVGPHTAEPKQRLDKHGESGLTHPAKAQAGERDAQLRGRKVGIQLPGDLQRVDSAALALLRLRLELRDALTRANSAATKNAFAKTHTAATNSLRPIGSAQNALLTLGCPPVSVRGAARLRPKRLASARPPRDSLGLLLALAREPWLALPCPRARTAAKPDNPADSHDAPATGTLLSPGHRHLSTLRGEGFRTVRQHGPSSGHRAQREFHVQQRVAQRVRRHPLLAGMLDHLLDAAGRICLMEH